MVLILAGNHAQAQDCIKTLGLDRSKAKYISDAHCVMGLRDPHVICFGTYWRRVDFDEIKGYLGAIGASFQYVQS